VASILDDNLIEGAETVIITLNSVDNALFSIDTNNDHATVTIADNDALVGTVFITAIDPLAAEAGPNPGQFVVDLGAINSTGNDITIFYDISGSATEGVDYNALSGNVVIADGAQTAVIDINVIDDALVEGLEAVTITLISTDNPAVSIDTSNDDATVVISDNDFSNNVSISITANDPNAAEAGPDPAQFTIDLGKVNNTGGDIIVNFTVTGTATEGLDYGPIGSSVTIVDGTQTAVIDISVIDDILDEGVETIVITLDNTNHPLFNIGPNNTDTVLIQDNDAPPQLTVTPFTIDRGALVVFDNSIVDIIDLDTIPVNLIITLTEINSASFVNVATGVPVTTFTFQEILNGTVGFLHDDSFNAPSFRFDLTDGTHVIDSGLIQLNGFDRGDTFISDVHRQVFLPQEGLSKIDIIPHDFINIASSDGSLGATDGIGNEVNSHDLATKVSISVEVESALTAQGIVSDPFTAVVPRTEGIEIFTVYNQPGITMSIEGVESHQGSFEISTNANEIRVKYTGHSDYDGETEFIAKIYKDNVMHHELHFSLNSGKVEQVELNGNGAVIEQAQVNEVYQLLNEAHLEEAIAKLENISVENGQGEVKAMIAELLDKVTQDNVTTFLTPGLLESIKDKLLNDQSIDVEQLLTEQDKERELGYRYQIEQTKHYLLKLFGKK
ncbi:hypothetical protein L3V83_08430, partial [Thiotrichales bacterium 19X7-9]|nr:hypothetical protein [Thiotrichales bacterium 19X7-9]